MCTDECRFSLRSDTRFWVRRSQNETYNPHCTLSSSNYRRSSSLLGCHCLRWDVAPHQSTQKMQFVGLYPYFGIIRSSVFPLNWDASCLATMLQFLTPMPQMNGKLIMTSTVASEPSGSEPHWKCLDPNENSALEYETWVSGSRGRSLRHLEQISDIGVDIVRVDVKKFWEMHLEHMLPNKILISWLFLFFLLDLLHMK